ncbi:DUF6119 family protein [Micromonospora peucetia]|uniref:TIGR04141 family sporadically distributed protein n=1 Tax=Micromonospora peucetia TaxID=47871 RepID=A0ABZ1EEW4_9ACTN|nr:DUF6119 family protein [Micromonospora peucetia]WSA32178.1 TIGR04141 family sporadically distributed protein [Micromonospora peucetia]
MRSAMNRTATGPTTRPSGRKDRRRTNPQQPTLFDSPLPPAPPGVYLTNVYRLRVPPTPDGLREALNVDYLRASGFEAVARQVANAPALLVHGTVPRLRADWCDVLAGLTGQEVDLGYSSGGGALFLAVDERAYALAYGTLGRFMVEHEVIDPTFGMSFAVRALLPSEIRQVRRRVVGTSGRVDRSLVPSGQPIRMYGIDKWGEIVGQVCGRTDNPRLTVCRRTGKPTRVEGGDALRVHLCVEPDGLLADLREIERVCQQESPLADLEFITQIRPVAPSDPRVSGLVATLDQWLGLADPPTLGVAVPGDLVADIEHVGSYRIQVPKSGQRATLAAELDLAAILAHTGRALDGDRWTGLRNGKVTLFADAGGTEEMVSTRASRWITAEVAVGASHLMLHEDAWYEIGDRHREFLRQEIAEILARSSDIVLPPWTPDLADEDAYNRAASSRYPRLVLLDKKLLRTAQHRRGIEACDLLGPDGELIHVKRGSSSAPLSHLFAQGITSVDALRYEKDARTRLIEVVRQQPNGRDLGRDFRPRKVVYAIALGAGRAVTADSLFTFAQVALYRAMKTLRSEGVEVEVVGIPPA